MTRPGSDEAPAGGTAQGSKDRDSTDSDSRAAGAADQAHRKCFATLQAELARRGYEVRRGAGNAMYIVRWGLMHEVSGIARAASFALQVGCSA